MLTVTTNLGARRGTGERGGGEDVERTLQLSLSVKSHQALREVLSGRSSTSSGDNILFTVIKANTPHLIRPTNFCQQTTE